MSAWPKCLRRHPGTYSSGRRPGATRSEQSPQMDWPGSHTSGISMSEGPWCPCLPPPSSPGPTHRWAWSPSRSLGRSRSTRSTRGSSSVKISRRVSPRQKLVRNAIRLLSFGPFFDDVEPADLRRVLQVRPATRAVVLGPDLDDSQTSDGRRDQIEEGAVSDLRVDDYPVFLKDADFVGGLDCLVAFGLDSSEILRGEAGGLEVHARSVRVQLVPHRASRVDFPDDTGQQVLGRVIPHVGVPPVPVDDPVDLPFGWQTVHVVPDHAFLLRHAKDLRLSRRPRQATRVVRLAAPLRVEGR